MIRYDTRGVIEPHPCSVRVQQICHAKLRILLEKCYPHVRPRMIYSQDWRLRLC